MTGWWEARDPALKLKIYFDYRVGTFYSAGKWQDLDEVKFMATDPLQFFIGDSFFDISVWRYKTPLSLTVFRESSYLDAVEFVRSKQHFRPIPGSTKHFYGEAPDVIVEAAKRLNKISPWDGFDHLFDVLKIGTDPEVVGGSVGIGGSEHFVRFDLGFDGNWILEVEKVKDELTNVRFHYVSGPDLPSALVFPYWSNGKVISAPRDRPSESLLPLP